VKRSAFPCEPLSPIRLQLYRLRQLPIDVPIYVSPTCRLCGIFQCSTEVLHGRMAGRSIRVEDVIRRINLDGLCEKITTLSQPLLSSQVRREMHTWLLGTSWLRRLRFLLLSTTDTPLVQLDHISRSYLSPTMPSAFPALTLSAIFRYVLVMLVL